MQTVSSLKATVQCGPHNNKHTEHDVTNIKHLQLVCCCVFIKKNSFNKYLVTFFVTLRSLVWCPLQVSHLQYMYLSVKKKQNKITPKFKTSRPCY